MMYPNKDIFGAQDVINRSRSAWDVSGPMCIW